MNLFTKIYNFINRLLLIRSKKRPYQFLLKRFEKISTIGLAQKVLDTEYFKDIISTVPADLSGIERIIVLSPHQDDETIGLGGTLLRFRDMGIHISIVFLTDGALVNYPTGMQDSIRIRNEEASKVCEILKADIHNLGISNYQPVIDMSVLNRLSSIIIDTNPDVIFVPWLLDSPAKHRMSNMILHLACKLRKVPDFEIWGYQVHNMILANIFVDITDEIDKKRQLLMIYESQIKYYAPYDHTTIGMNAWNARFYNFEALTSSKKYLELFFAVPSRDYFALIENYYKDIEQTFGTEKKVRKSMEDLLDEISSL